MKRRGRSRVAFVVVDFPDDDEVLAHGFRFRPAWWTPRVSDGWGGFLEQLPAQDRGYCPITRADLLDTAETHGLPQALLASYVW
jgi:Putative 8-oxoguanine DNA glycosylase OGG-like protein